MMEHISSDVLSVDIVNEDTTTLGQLNKNVSINYKKKGG
jgi:phosphoacetylglucosamine mutase